MALPASPPINRLQINAEFSAPPGTLLTAMVRGGAFVPNTPANAAVPTAPPIDLLDFLGASNISAVLQSVNQGAFALSPADATVNVQWLSNGFCTASINAGAPSNLYQWLLGGTAGQFELMATNQIGDLGFVTGTAFGVWVSGATGVGWTLTNTSNLVNNKSVQFDLFARRTSDAVVVSSCSVLMTADIDV